MQLTVEEIKNIFDNIIDEDVEKLGFNPKHTHPKNLIFSALPVIPPKARPYVYADGNICDDDLTMQYCLHEDTPILLWNGKTKLAKYIKDGDKLIGDDGGMRTVQTICSGIDDMYEVQQTHGDNYIVNSKHTLTLKFSGHGEIFWGKSRNAWQMLWFNPTTTKRCIK